MCILSNSNNKKDAPYCKLPKKVKFAEHIDEMQFDDDTVEFVVRPVEAPPLPLKLLGSAFATPLPTLVRDDEWRAQISKHEREMANLRKLIANTPPSSNTMPSITFSMASPTHTPMSSSGNARQNVVFCMECGCEMQTSFKFCCSCGQSLHAALQLRTAACAA